MMRCLYVLYLHLQEERMIELHTAVCGRTIPQTTSPIPHSKLVVPNTATRRPSNRPHTVMFDTEYFIVSHHDAFDQGTQDGLGTSRADTNSLRAIWPRLFCDMLFPRLLKAFNNTLFAEIIDSISSSDSIPFYLEFVVYRSVQAYVTELHVCYVNF